jgi:NitT/TauT family transport system substrate-binding protein
MRKLFVGVAAALALAVPVLSAPSASAETTVRVGWPLKAITIADAPFAVAMKMGWFAENGLKVELVPLAGSTASVRYIGTRELPFAMASLESVGIFQHSGIKAKAFYTTYQSSVYGIAVPANSKIKSVKDLKDARIGVVSMAAGPVPLTKALVAEAGLDPKKDISIIVAGQGAQTLALMRNKQLDALSQYDMLYAFIENSGIPMRVLDTKLSSFPGQSFIALEDTLKEHRAEAVALAQGYAKGTIFTINNPEAAIKILWEVYPQTKPVGKDDATALRQQVNFLKWRIPAWILDKSGAKKWGENSEARYQNYLDFLHENGVLKEPVKASEIIVNDLLPAIDNFDPDKVAAKAKAYKYIK